MSVQEKISGFGETKLGKVAIVVAVIVCVGLAVFMGMNSLGGEPTRVVPAAQVKSEAQQQIDAINKMTNLTEEQKKAMIAHEQGEIDKASGQGGAGRGGPANSRKG